MIIIRNKDEFSEKITETKSFTARKAFDASSNTLKIKIEKTEANDGHRLFHAYIYIGDEE